MVHYKIRRGRWPASRSAAAQVDEATKLAGTVAILGTDFPQLRPAFQVEPGAQVSAGQVLFTDRQHPEIAHVAPVSGTVKQITYGPRRALGACIIEREPQATPHDHNTPFDVTTETSVRQILQSQGLWPAFRTRPFGRTPVPQAQPAAIFVTATQTSPSAPDPHLVLEGQARAFCRGVEALTKLTRGMVYVCQSKGDPLCEATDRIDIALFSGTEAAGLASTHIDRLCPVQSGRQVWTVGYQDVAAMGHLLLSGQFLADRVVSVTQGLGDAPKLMRTTLGACLKDLATHPAHSVRASHASFLGRFQDQVTLESPAPIKPKRQGALIPTSGLELALAPRVLAVPLMRALSVGDSEAARRLGCLALVEEDVADLSRLCTSGADYGDLLRQVLDELMEDAA